MVTIKVSPEELKVIIEAAKRVARRTNRKLVIHWDRIEIPFDTSGKSEG